MLSARALDMRALNTRVIDAGARGAVSEGLSSKRSIEERNPMLNLIDKSFDARARTASLIRHAGGRYTWVLSTRALYALDSTQALDKSLTRRAVMARRVALDGYNSLGEFDMRESKCEHARRSLDVGFRHAHYLKHTLLDAHDSMRRNGACCSSWAPDAQRCVGVRFAGT